MMQDLASRCLAGEPRAVARLISRLEDGDRDAFGTLAALKERAGHAHVIGITGPPGSGKSTLTDKLIGEFRTRGKRVGVIAVDPSSPFSGGAILGDRLRMQNHATDPGVFIRSLASRGKLGGLSRATAFAVRALEAAGYDIVIIETVGVGQSEIDIVKVADTVVLVSVPGLGDDIQVIKAGIMEIGDVFVVNKSDRDGADRVVREIRAMLETQAMLQRGRAPGGGPDTLAARAPDILHHGQADMRPETLPEKIEMPLPPVIKTIAETGEGVAALAALVMERFSGLTASGELEQRRHASIKAQLQDLVGWQMLDFFAAQEGEGLLGKAARNVQFRNTDIYSAARELFSLVLKGVAAQGGMS
jgi:LAO/AO transport system kinase